MVSSVNNNTAIVEYKAEDNSASEMDARIASLVKQFKEIIDFFSVLNIKIQEFCVSITQNIRHFALAISVKIQVLLVVGGVV